MASHIRQQMRRRMRLPLRRVLKDEQPERPVLCYEELDTKLNIRVMERVSLPETHP
jgi:flagellar biosynthesis component FlhA